MFGLLSWTGGTKNEKVMPVKTQFQAAGDHKPANVTLPTLNKMKRKRRDSEDSLGSQINGKPIKKRLEYMSHVEVSSRDSSEICEGRRPEVHEILSDLQLSIEPSQVNGVAATREDQTPRTPIPSNSVQDRGTTTKPTQPFLASRDMTAVQQTIESQFSLEILMKHNELRLIDQEIAKVQIALEQLRRCELVPYPAQTSRVSDMQAVSSGIGPAYGYMNDGKPIEAPAPWGVMDGPYTRHYARFLIPGPIFDGGLADDVQPQRHAGKKLMERTTRGSKADKVAGVAKSRSQRGSGASRLQALPAGYPEPKEDKGPMIVKRSTDGRMVKLVCLDCRRENFNSAQGFINHCRIAHSRNLASHDAAAIACGEEVEISDAGGIVSDSTPGNLANAGLVHPLIRSAHVAPTIAQTATPKRRKSHSKSDSTSQVPGGFRTLQATSSPAHTPATSRLSNAPFVPSPQAPHLSALFARSGLGGDLSEFVRQATTKEEIEADMSSDSGGEDVDMEDAPERDDAPRSLTTRGIIRSDGRLPAHATMSPAPLDRPISCKGPDHEPSRKPEFINTSASKNPQHTYSSPYAAASQPTRDGSNPPLNTSNLPPSPLLNLSPNTIELNPAPSLVSDDDDDYEDPHSESEGPSSASEHDQEDRYLDIEVEDEDEEGGSGPSRVDPDLASAVKARAHPAPRRRNSSRTGRTRDGERHVTFQGVSRRERRRAEEEQVPEKGRRKGPK